MFFRVFLSFNYSLSSYCSINFTLVSISVWTSVILVILSFLWFVPWYMESECSKRVFYCLIRVFSFSILGLSVVNFRLVFMLFWEILRICSYMLVRWWGRRDIARTMAVVRVISSRLRDFFLFVLYFRYFQSNSLLSLLSCIMAISSKSAQLFYFPWLLRAIERPGPVSALLHSSTLVLARVILGYYLRLFRIRTRLLVSGSIGLFLRVVRTFIFVDLKKRVACSTVYNVRLMFIWLSLDILDVLSVHLVVHALLKSCAFSVLRVTSHLSATQDTRITISNNRSILVVFFKILLRLLSFIPLIRLIMIKETVVEVMAYTSLNVLYVTVLHIVSFWRVVFFLESLTYSNSRFIVDYKFISSPSFNVSYITLIYPLILILRVDQQSCLTSGNRIELSFFTLLRMGAICITITYFRSSFNHSKYLTEYNNYFFRPNGSKVGILYNFEFVSLVIKRSSLFYSSYVYRRFSIKVSYMLISLILAIFLTLAFLS